MAFADEDWNVLSRFHEAKYSPAVIYDIGASDGSWTRRIRPLFDTARFELFEPLAERNAAYDAGIALTKRLPNCTFHPIALGDAAGEANLAFLNDTGVGSSLLGVSPEGSNILKVQVKTLDDMIESGEIPPAQVIKMDTQGSELNILLGAQNRALPHAELVLIESWLVRGYGPSTPLLSEVMAFMDSHGFLPFELADEYRNDAGLLVSKDVWYVRRNSLAAQIVWGALSPAQLP